MTRQITARRGGGTEFKKTETVQSGVICVPPRARLGLQCLVVRGPGSATPGGPVLVRVEKGRSGRCRL
jgi:hypothetical protein